MATTKMKSSPWSAIDPGVYDPSDPDIVYYRDENGKIQRHPDGIQAVVRILPMLAVDLVNAVRRAEAARSQQ